MRNWFFASWSGLLGGVFFGGAFFCIYKLFISPDYQFLTNALGAFMGAFFAFTFVRITDFLKAIRDRRKSHLNGLVEVERLFNEHLASISDNLFIAPDFCAVVRSGGVHPFGFRPLRVERTIYSQLHNKQLLNKLFQFDDGVRKVNMDLDSLRDLYLGLRQGLMEGRLTNQAYQENGDFLARNVEELSKFIERLKSEALEILAISRIRCRSDKPLLTRIERFFLPGLESTPEPATVEKEIARIVREQTPI